MKHLKHKWFRNGKYLKGNELCGYCYICGCKRERKKFPFYIYTLKGKEFLEAPECIKPHSL